MLEIRLATPADAEAIQAIYAPYCGESTVSFELVAPTADEIGQRMAQLAEGYPWIVCERGGEVLAYAYAGPHHPRAAYVWSVTTSVYVAAAVQARGLGRGMYRSLLELLKLQGFLNAVALISVPHAASTHLHAAMGFNPVGVFRHIGYKSGGWRDVELWQKQLAPLPERPAQPISVATASQLPEWAMAMSAGVGSLRIR
jgi:L-amino acid N-acyltransferase YncA